MLKDIEFQLSEEGEHLTLSTALLLKIINEIEEKWWHPIFGQVSNLLNQ